MKIRMSFFLLAAFAFVLVVIGEGMPLRSYCLYVLGGILIIYCLAPIITEGESLFFCAELWALTAFLAYSGFSCLWALDPALAFYRTKGLFFLTVLVILTTQLFVRESDAGEMILLYWAMGVLLSLLCILHFGPSGLRQMIVSGTRLGKDEALFMGKNSNMIGMDCATAGILSLYYAVFKNRRAALWAVIPTAVIVVATGSRKGLFIFLFGMILLLFFQQIWKEKKKGPTLLHVLLFAAGLALVFSCVTRLPGMEKLREHYMGVIHALIGNEEQIDLSTKARGNMVAVGWEQFLRTPFWGVGLDNGKVVNQAYNHISAYLHNNYIEVLVNGGLMGFCMYGSFYLLLLMKHIRRIHEKNPLVYISLALLILRLISDWGRVSYFDYMNILLYPFWIAVSNGYDLDQESSRPPQEVFRFLRS